MTSCNLRNLFAELGIFELDNESSLKRVQTKTSVDKRGLNVVEV